MPASWCLCVLVVKISGAARGTPLFASTSARPDRVGIRAGSLDDPSWFRAAADVWVSSAQPWDVMDSSVPKFPKDRPRRET